MMCAHREVVGVQSSSAGSDGSDRLFSHRRLGTRQSIQYTTEGYALILSRQSLSLIAEKPENIPANRPAAYTISYLAEIRHD